MVILICSIIFVLGVLGVVVGMRGRRIDDHPVCRKCRYDLSGTASLPAACPECGRDLSTPARSVRIGNRGRKRGLLIGGATAAVLAIAVGGLWSFQVSRGFDFNTIKPVWWLRAEIDSSDSETADAARVELLARHSRDELSESAQAALIDPILALQADADGPWHTDWADFFEQAWLSGLVTDEQLRRYLTTAVEEGLRLRVRQHMRQGSRVAIGLPLDSRTPRDSNFSMAYAVEEVNLADLNLTETFVGNRDPWSIRRFRAGRSGEEYYYFKVDAPVGVHTLTLRTRIVAGEGQLSAHSAGEQPFERPLIDRELTLTAPIEVVPADTDVMNVVDTQEIRDAIRSAVTFKRPQLKADGDGQAAILGTLRCNDSPIDFNALVIWRIDGEEHRAGTLDAGPEGYLSYAETSWGGWHKVPLDGPPERVDIVLRATAEMAERTPRLMNDTECWVGEIVFEEVAVEYLGVDELPYETIETDEALEQMRRAINVSAVELRQVGDTVAIHTRGGFAGLPYHFAFSCNLRLDEREYPGMSSMAREGDSRELTMGELKAAEFPADLRTIDVVFTPNPRMGARMFSKDDIVFNRRIVIEDVPVIWIRE